MNTITKLIALYNNKSETIYHNMVGLMLEHIHELPQMSIYEVADVCFSSTTAISRFVRKLEYENFNSFKMSLHNALNYYPQSNRKMSVTKQNKTNNFIEQYLDLLCAQIHSIRNHISLEMIDEIASIISNSYQVVFVSPAMYGFDSFQFDLIIDKKKTFFSDNLSNSLEDIQKVDSDTAVLFFISAERESERTRMLLKKAKEQGGKVIAIARETLNMHRKYTDIEISYESTGTDMDDQIFLTIMNLIIIRYRSLYID